MTAFLIPTVMTKTPTKDITMVDLVQFLDKAVSVTVHDGPRQVQNGPTRWAGMVSSVFQRDHQGQGRYAGDGSIRFNDGSQALWSAHDLVTVQLIEFDEN